MKRWGILVDDGEGYKGFIPTAAHPPRRER